MLHIYCIWGNSDPDQFAVDWAVRGRGHAAVSGIGSDPWSVWTLPSCHSHYKNTDGPTRFTFGSYLTAQGNLFIKTFFLWNLLKLTSVASPTAAGHTATSATSKAATGLPELLTGLPSLSPEHQRFAALADRSAVIPTSSSTCRQTQHTFDNDREKVQRV